MAMFHLLKIRMSIDIFKNEKCKVTFGLEYMKAFRNVAANTLLGNVFFYNYLHLFPLFTFHPLLNCLLQDGPCIITSL